MPPSPPAEAAQDLAHRARQIVVAKQTENAAEVGEGVLVCLEERLLCGEQVRWNAAPLAIDRIANTCTLVRSSPRSIQASYQSTWAS
jgi:hypothetical protein